MGEARLDIRVQVYAPTRMGKTRWLMGHMWQQHNNTCAEECNNTDPEHLYPLSSHSPAIYEWTFSPHDMLDARVWGMEAVRQQSLHTHRKWSALTGVSLTIEQAAQLEDAATKLAAITATDRRQIETHLSRLVIHAERARIQQEAFAALSAMAVDFISKLGQAFAAIVPTASHFCGDMDYGISQGQPNYDHWWVGLEHTRSRDVRAQTYTRVHRPNTRGSYHYQGKAQSYWRHTRTR